MIVSKVFLDPFAVVDCSMMHMLKEFEQWCSCYAACYASGPAKRKVFARHSSYFDDPYNRICVYDIHIHFFE